MTRASEPWITQWPPTTRFTPHPDWTGQWPLIPRPIVDHAMWIGLLGVAATGTVVLAWVRVMRSVAQPAQGGTP